MNGFLFSVNVFIVQYVYFGIASDIRGGFFIFGDAQAGLDGWFLVWEAHSLGLLVIFMFSCVSRPLL